MIITSKETGAGFEFDERRAIAISQILTPILCDMPASERIGAMAMQIAFAMWEESGEQHPSLDSLAAHVAGCVVEYMTAAGFRAQRAPVLCDDEAEGGEDASA